MYSCIIFTADCLSFRNGWPFIICTVVFVEGWGSVVALSIKFEIGTRFSCSWAQPLRLGPSYIHFGHLEHICVTQLMGGQSNMNCVM